jgi:hypothetical protein
VANQVVPLEAENVSVSTATISIKMVQVGKKQMTLSVFRQLEPTTLIDEVNLTLNGDVWGYVNYHWNSGGGGGVSRKTNFLVQQGSFLRRCLVWVRPSCEFSHDSIDDLPGPVRSSYFRFKHLAEALVYSRSLALIDSGENAIKQCNVKCGPFGYNFYHDYSYTLKSRGYWEKRLIDHFGDKPDVSILEHELRSIGQFLREYCARWDALMVRLEAVEQLFIAV